MIETSNDDGLVSSRHRRRSADLTKNWLEIEPRLVASLRRKGAGLHDAEDIAQDTAVQVLRKTHHDLSDPKDMLKFAHHVASCFWIDKQRKAARERDFVLAHEPRPETDVAVEAVDRVMSIDAWFSLSDEQRDVLAFAHLPPAQSKVYEARRKARGKLEPFVEWLGAAVPFVGVRRLLGRVPARRIAVAAAALTIALGAEDLLHSRRARRPEATAPASVADPSLSPTTSVGRPSLADDASRTNAVPATKIGPSYRSAIDLPERRVPIGPTGSPVIIVGTEDSEENEPVLCYGVVPVLMRTICVGNSTRLEEALLLR